MELFKKLYAEFILSYEEVHANILDDIKFSANLQPHDCRLADLFLKGNVNLLNEKSICVVGSRNASNESIQKTEKIDLSLLVSLLCYYINNFKTQE